MVRRCTTFPLTMEKLKENEESLELYKECHTKFEQASENTKKDAFTLRSWGDTLHDYGKQLISST